jgi:diacylglycerol kinase family enzyme
LASGSGDAEPVEDRLADVFRRRQISAELQAFEPTTLRDDLRALLAHQPDAVIVAGGDGTIRSVAEYTAGSGVPLGVLPAGTMNLLARDLGIPEETEAAVDALLAAPVQMIDLARVNDQVFLCSSALAMMPHLGRIRERARGRIAPSLRLWARAIQVWRRYPRMRLTVVVDGQEHPVRTRAMVVSNNPLSPRPGPPGRDRLDTGRLVVYLTQARTRWDLLGLAAKLPTGTWLTDRRLRTYEGESVQVHTSQLTMMSVMSDGEIVQLEVPLRYEIEPRALAVLAPGATPS